MTQPSSILRVAAIDFLNAAPLMWGLENEPRLRLFHTVPSECAEAMRQGRAELGVIPVIELARIPGLVGLAGLGVAARAQVRSILLISRVPPARMGRVALDRASRTSAALVRILLAQHWGAECAAVDNTGDWRAGLEVADGVLVIGDPALRLSVSGEPGRAGYEVRDLASAWFEWTGLPFVFALWGIRREALAAHPWLPERLQAARRQARAEAAQLVERWRRRLELPAGEIRHYLEADVEYDLGEDHGAGLRRFFELAAGAGLLHTAEVPEMAAVEATAE